MILGIHVARQLWLQLRLLVLLALPPVAALVAITVEWNAGSEAGRAALATGLAVAAVLSSALVGAAFAEEIGSGAAAWLIVRAVPRSSLLGAWWVLPGLTVVTAFILGGVLAGLALRPPVDRVLDPVTVTVTILAAAAPALPLTAAALAVAVDAPPRVALVATVAGSAVLAVVLVLGGDAVIHPASGYWVVAGRAPVDQPISVGLQAIGLCLVLSAVIWAAAARRFGSRDL